MDYSLLAESARPVKETAALTSPARTQSAAEGLALLQQAMRAGFTQPELLRQGFEILRSCLAQNPDHPDALCGMAWLLALCGRTDLARLYLARVLSQDFDHAYAAELWDALGEPAHSQSDWVEIDYDSLLEALESMLKASMQRFSQAQIPGPEGLGFDQPARTRIAELESELKLMLSQSRQYLELLQQEIDTDSLYVWLRPLRSIAHRLGGHLEAQAEYAELEAALQDGQQQCRQLLNALSQGALSQTEAPLEALLDRCDALADRIDALEARHYRIPTLIRSYTAWVEAIRLLQDQLDEH